MKDIRKVIKLRGRFHPIVFKGVVSMENHSNSWDRSYTSITSIHKRWIYKRYEIRRGFRVLRPIGHMKPISLFTLTGDLNNKKTGISYIE